MPILRAILGAVGVLALIAAVIAVIVGAAVFAVFWLFAVGIVLVVGVLFERVYYKKVADHTPGPDWVATPERFVDPTTGRMVRVYTKPITGERIYIIDEDTTRD